MRTWNIPIQGYRNHIHFSKKPLRLEVTSYHLIDGRELPTTDMVHVAATGSISILCIGDY
jgi:hypothetical protein